ncbi:MAG: ComEA family DNA-binding protein [Ilumatobacteraceae bacterium]
MDSSLPRPAPPRSPGERFREWVVWFGPGRLAATALAIIAVVVGATWLLEGSPSRAEDQLPFAGRSTTSTNTSIGPASGRPSVSASSTSVATSIVVYVAGAVAVPGVYTLDNPARVTDAVAAAGGVAAGADLDVVNLAATVHDGERVYVPKVGGTVPPVVGADVVVVDNTTAVGPVNVNSATAEQLDVLPGVGPATAAAIVSHRQLHGPFQTVEQLADVRGIGPAKLDALRGLVAV